MIIVPFHWGGKKNTIRLLLHWTNTCLKIVMAWQMRQGSWRISQEVYSPFPLKFSLQPVPNTHLPVKVPTIMKQGRQQLPGGFERENPFTQWSGGIDVRDEKNWWEVGGSQNGKAPESKQQCAFFPIIWHKHKYTHALKIHWHLHAQVNIHSSERHLSDILQWRF